MSIKNFWRNYFYFNRKERSGIRFLLILIILLTVFLISFPYLFPPQPFDYSAYAGDIEKLQAAQEKEKEARNFNYQNSNYPSEKSGKTSSLFSFNPNTLDAKGWQKLGLSEKQAAVITRYTEKGGKFYKKEDVKKMVVISDDFYRKIENYIEIPVANTAKENVAHLPETATKAKVILNLNQADSLELLEISGIGEKLAARIIKYRDRLGGFYSTNQLKEIYGLSEDNFLRMQQQLTIQPNQITLININYCGLNELAAHPYLGKAKANKIIQYRNKNGTFKKVENVLELELLDSATFEKVKPYFVVQ